MYSFIIIFMIINLKVLIAFTEEFCFATITIKNKYDASSQNLYLSGIYSVKTQTHEIEGNLILAKSYSTKNQTQLVTNGCTAYNESTIYGYISLVDQGDCTFDEQIEYASNSNAIGLIIISQNSKIYKIKNSKNNPLVVVMIANDMGQKLKMLLESDRLNVSITPKACETRDYFIESEFNYQRLSYVSIWFIVVGNLCLLLLLGGTCTIFYIVQKARLIEERERMDRLIDRLTKRAISKMKCKKIKPDDQHLNEVCVICMENYKANDTIRILPCSHIFHKDEIDQWINENKTCPVCKIDILRYYGIERLRIIRSNEEITQAILAHENNRRRDTVFSIQGTSQRFSIFSNNQPNSNEFTINSVEQRNTVYAEFHKNHLKSFSLDDLDGIKENTNRRLTFFGEKLPQNEALLAKDETSIQMHNDDAVIQIPKNEIVLQKTKNESIDNTPKNEPIMQAIKNKVKEMQKIEIIIQDDNDSVEALETQSTTINTLEKIDIYKPNLINLPSSNETDDDLNDEYEDDDDPDDDCDCEDHECDCEDHECDCEDEDEYTNESDVNKSHSIESEHELKL